MSVIHLQCRVDIAQKRKSKNYNTWITHYPENKVKWYQGGQGALICVSSVCRGGTPSPTWLFHPSGGKI